MKVPPSQAEKLLPLLTLEIRSDIAAMDYNTQATVNKAVRQMEAESLKASQIKSEIKEIVRSEMTATVNEFKEFGKRGIVVSLNEIKTELSATAKEIEKQKEDMKTQGLFRKIFFWAMPALLFIDTILLIIFMS